MTVKQALAEMVAVDILRFVPDKSGIKNSDAMKLNKELASLHPFLYKIYETDQSNAKVIREKHDVKEPKESFMNRQKAATESFINILYAIEPLIRDEWNKASTPLLKENQDLLKQHEFIHTDKLFTRRLNKINEYFDNPQAKFPRLYSDKITQ